MHFFSISELSSVFRAKKLSPVEVTNHLLDRIESTSSTLAAYVTVTAERARSQARRAEQEMMAGNWRGTLHGVPLAFKDIFFSDFAPTTAGGLVHKNFLPSFSSTTITRLEAAGAITLGKLKTTEHAFAEHHPALPPPLNPWDSSIWTGVSSSGSGVATAAGLAYGTLASDTGGSIRFPAAANGVTGLKPTWGRVSRHGVFELAATLDHVGPMARTAMDCAILLDNIAGFDINDRTSLVDPVPNYEAAALQPIGGLRVGLPVGYAEEDIDVEIVAAWRDAAAVLQDLGAVLIEVPFPDWRNASSQWAALCSAQTALAHSDTYPARADEYGTRLRSLLDKGLSASATEIASALQSQVTLTSELRTLFSTIDVLLTPVTIWPIPTVLEWSKLAGEELTDLVRFTVPFNFSGNPCLTLPAGVDHRGLPVSIQLVGQHLGEEAILRAGVAFQRSTNWHTRRPPAM
ncbi:amidase [Paraburkholderia bannensis]|uniref:amidase n=1 Tax=Paraburkholderia bannensis TaxID=765414 RepID=UPI002AB7CE06|nr:amidase [Paraburkholderia bannensis]